MDKHNILKYTKRRSKPSIIMTLLTLLPFLGVLAAVRSSLGFVHQPSCQRQFCRTTKNHVKRSMVRNIDLVEAIVFYGTESLFESSDETNGSSKRRQVLPGVEYLLEECKRDETAVIAILENDDDGSNNYEDILPKGVHLHLETQPPPNPRDLWEATHSITINPKGFGGSSGFGTKAADPERSPLPKHVVVLCDTEDKTRAARYAGMRVLCLNDNDLADGIVDGWDTICMDDIATPGSFWLNPPHPRDDESNSVDPEKVMLAYESNQTGQNKQNRDTSRSGPSSNVDKNDSVVVNLEDAMMSDDQLKAILADMDPL